MFNSDEDDDIFIEDQELSRKIIAQKEYQKSMGEHYDVGYHGGLIGGIENKEQVSKSLEMKKLNILIHQPVNAYKILLKQKKLDHIIDISILFFAVSYPSSLILFMSFSILLLCRGSICMLGLIVVLECICDPESIIRFDVLQRETFDSSGGGTLLCDPPPLTQVCCCPINTFKYIINSKKTTDLIKNNSLV